MGNRNSGRRPKATVLKVLRGVTRRDRLNPAEPKPPVGPVEQPSTLSRGAAVIWSEVAPICLAMGTLTTADVRAFAAYCELQATFTAAALMKDSDPEQFSARLERETAVALRPYFDYFGLNPAARSRIVVAAKTVDEPVSRWAGELA